ncbi:MAG TPA: M67 family metallopeptidase [Thermoplasmata archaeon]|nr:M67 family metallopeptidase [Thermoplasmata archaeon]
MTSVRLAEGVLDTIRGHARETYPDECCGFLLGAVEPGMSSDRRNVGTAERAPNEFAGERRRRFLILPEELRAAEARADARGLVVVGFYHSHPDHPARPSAYDRDHAWPWYVYLVVSITSSEVPAVGVFELDGDRGEFDEVGFQTGAAPTSSLGR